MYSSRMLLSISAAVALTALAVTALHGAQSRQAAPSPTDPVVAEIRALRADMNERLDAAIKAQLLVTRLSVQEQRTNAVARQLQEIEGKLRDTESTKEQVTAGMKMFVDLTKSAADNNPLSAQLHAEMERIAKADTELKTQQTELMRQLTEEQGRWTAINARLEELDRMVLGQRK
jgi:predicted  nucleic acid-binding Zn-ribbon protein